MKYKRLYNWIFLLFATTLLVACGFHLRGTNGIGGDQLSFSSIYIDFPADSQTSARLKRLIKGMKLTKLANNPKEAEVILSAISEKKNKDYLSLNAQGRVREYSLDYILELRKSYRVYILSNTNPYVMSWACSPEFSSQGK